MCLSFQLCRKLKIGGQWSRPAGAISKITRVKRVSGTAQVEEYLTSRYEALSSNLTTKKKKKSNIGI
jgi:hypothetical protein